MNRVKLLLGAAVLIPLSSLAQNVSPSSSALAPDPGGDPSVSTRPMQRNEAPEPFSRVALSAGVSIMGINLQTATNVNRYSNIRTSGNVFSYSVKSISTNGFTADGTLDMATLGVSFDLFPFPEHGFRVSPGLLLLNHNSLTAHATTESGSFTLNHVEYTSSPTDPIRATGRIGLNATNPAFTLTTGWGNLISRRSGHWSFPFEIGAAFVGTPSFKMTLAGTACDAQRLHCVNAATDPGIQSNLQAQIAKYRRDLDPLKTYPILSIGVGYNFKVR